MLCSIIHDSLYFLISTPPLLANFNNAISVADPSSDGKIFAKEFTIVALIKSELNY